MDPDLFNNKTIAIVGNSVRIFDREDGAEIDAHEVVIRFNLVWPWQANRPKCTGSKTTHMRIGGREFRAPAAAANFARVMRQYPGVHFHSAKADPTKWNIVSSPVPLAPDEIYQKWRDELQTEYEPSSGAGLLYYLTNYCRPRSIALYGLDGLQSPIWYKQRNHLHDPCHSAEVETRYLEKVIREFPYVTIHPADALHRRETEGART
jgi:hypothetical protein